MSARQQQDEETAARVDRSQRDAPLLHKTVILAGLIQRVALKEWLETGVLQIELHDRDVLASLESRMEQDERRESSARDPAGKFAAADAAWEATVAERVRSGDTNTHGIAKARLRGLASTSFELQRGSHETQSLAG